MKSLTRRKLKNPLLNTLVHLKGNERACLWLEPLWGVPYNLYQPFVSVYMTALGLSSVQIGTVTTVFFLSQMVWSLLSGVLADKLGRRKCTVIFDVLSWSVPALIWMCAQNYWWFLVAAVLNGMWRVTENSWGLLLIEEAPQEKLVRLYSISHMAGLIAGFVAPIPYFFVRQYSVVPTMRVLYGITFVMMTAKFLILFFWCHETSVGKRRMAECRDIGIFSRLWDSRRVLHEIVLNRRVMLTLGIVACFITIKNVNTDFWPLLVTDRLGIPEENLSIFATIRSLLMLVSYLFLVPRISVFRFRIPLYACFLLMGGLQVLLFFLPPGAYGLVILDVAAEALVISMLNPLTTSLQMICAGEEERARIIGVFYALCLLVTAPFGMIAGSLSAAGRNLPFLLNLGLSITALALSVRLARDAQAAP